METRIDRSKVSAPISPLRESATIDPNVQDRFDAIPEMSAIAQGPVSIIYETTPVAHYTNSRSVTSPTYSGLEPMPPFQDRIGLSAQSSMVSLRAEYTSFSSPSYGQAPHVTPRRPLPRSLQSEEDPRSLRSSSDHVSYNPASLRAPLYEQRPRSAMGNARDQRRASMRLVSGGYDRLL